MTEPVKKGSMPKVSFASSAITESKNFGVTEGSYEIVTAITKIHQYPQSQKPGAGAQGDPFPCVQIGFTPLDESGNRTDEDPILTELGVGKLEKFHPGIAENADDDDPQDAGEEVDVEGNCIYATEASNRLHAASKWSHFVKSLETAGFRSDILGNGYMPDIIGTKLHVKTITLPRTAGYTGKNDPTALVVESIEVRPYEKAKGKAGAKTAPKAAPVAAKPVVAAKVTPKAAVKPATVAEPEENEVNAEFAGIAMQTLHDISIEKAGQSDLKTAVIRNAFVAKLIRAKVPTKDHKSVIEIFKNPAWLAETSESLGLAYDAEADTLSFPEAA